MTDSETGTEHVPAVTEEYIQRLNYRTAGLSLYALWAVGMVIWAQNSYSGPMKDAPAEAWPPTILAGVIMVPLAWYASQFTFSPGRYVND